MPAAKKTAKKEPAAVKKPAVKKPAAKKPAAPKAKKTAAKKPAAKKAVSAEERYRMVAEAAYYLALKKGPESDPLQNWVEAEAQIAAELG